MLMEVDVRAELQILPESLADLYKAACDQIERAAPSSRHIATTTLRWLLCAQRPMSTQEIIGAISVDHEAKVTSLTAEQIVATCRNMVVHDQDLDVLRFAHLSVQDYLESRDGFTTTENESVVAERCLDVVSATYSTLQVRGLTLQQNLDLQAYATVHWPFHYRNIEPEKVPARFEKKIFRFFFRRHDGAFTNWLSAFSQKCQTYEDDIQIKTAFPSTLSDPPTPLFVACIFGFPKVLAHLAQTSQDDLDRCNSLGQSALSLATEHGQFEIVRLLLQPSLHDDAQAALPLTWALPVEHDPEVVYYIAALQAAVASKRPEVVDMILARGRQRRDDTRLFDYALEVAAWMGDRSTVSLLLSRGADVRYPRPGHRFHLLALAAILGMHDLAERLLDNGVDVSVLSWDGRGMSVLEYAALNNNPSIITLAMERGASVITANMVQNISAFHDAATYNHPECIQTLFEGTLKSEGREEALRIINLMTSQSGETALHYAASKGYCSATSLLLDLGAAISDDKQGVSAFQAAVVNGQLEVAKIFLSKPGLKELTRRASWNNSIALHSASYHGHLEICEVLLSHDANSLFLQNDELDTPLHCAAMKGHASVALLLVKAAEKQHDLGERRWIDKQNKRQKTPLIEAASNGFPRVVKILLEHGADPTVQASGGKLGKDYASYNPFSGLNFTVLHAAIAFQEWECVEILITHCVATMSASELSRWLDMRDRKGRSALALAAEANASEYVDLLVKNGATLSSSSSLLEPDNQAYPTLVKKRERRLGNTGPLVSVETAISSQTYLPVTLVETFGRSTGSGSLGATKTVEMKEDR
jgi:ankyrin repeat protein